MATTNVVTRIRTASDALTLSKAEVMELAHVLFRVEQVCRDARNPLAGVAGLLAVRADDGA